LKALVRSFRSSGSLYYAMQRHISEDEKPQLHRCASSKMYFDESVKSLFY